MANYKVPRTVEIVDELPLNATGKVMKEVLRGGPRREAGGRGAGRGSRERRSGSDLTAGPGQKAPCDDEALDLVGALADDHQAARRGSSARPGTRWCSRRHRGSASPRC